VILGVLASEILRVHASVLTYMLSLLVLSVFTLPLFDRCVDSWTDKQLSHMKKGGNEKSVSTKEDWSQGLTIKQKNAKE
jgi:hypothetical protein